MNKVCIISSAIPPNHSGAGLSAFKYAYRLYERNQLSFICTRTKADITPELYKKLLGVENGNLEKKILRTTAKPSWIDKNPLTKIIFFPIDVLLLSIKTSILLIINNKHYDIIHCFSPTWFSLIAIIVGKVLGKKVVLELTRLDGDDPGYVAEHDILNILYQRRNIQYKLADAIVCISPILFKRCVDNNINKNKLFIIPRPVNTRHFYPTINKCILRKKYMISCNASVILFVGGITPRKNVHIAIKVVEIIKKDNPQIILIVVGPEGSSIKDKKYYHTIKQYIEEKDLNSNVRFAGYVANVNEYMKLSDIFIFPSYSEGFPNVLVEAMASGLPVVAKEIKGITDYIFKNSICGNILDSDNPYDFVQAIRVILNDTDLYKKIASNALELASKNFMEDIVDRKYERLYQKLNYKA